jgi:gamma-glutamyltranspeptidase
MTLSDEIAELRAKLASLAERVRLHETADAFLRSDHVIREGDYFLYYKEFATKLTNVNSEGKWTFFDGHHSVEPHRIPDQADHARLYTIAEVAEIVAQARKL